MFLNFFIMYFLEYVQICTFRELPRGFLCNQHVAFGIQRSGEP